MAHDPAAASAAEEFATEFINRLRLENESQQRCEWSCILWSKDHWASQAQKSKINLHQTKDRPESSQDPRRIATLFENSEFLNTVAQLYSKLFVDGERSCSVKTFSACPFMAERDQLLRKGTLASVFATILHKATLYSMLEEHPIDSGLLDEDYTDVYGVNLTNYEDLEESLQDGRFERLFEATVERARQLAGQPQRPTGQRPSLP